MLLKKLILLPYFILLTACDTKPDVNPTSPAPPAPSSVSYQIIKDESLHDIKRSVDILLPKKVSDSELQIIALEIKRSDRVSYERTFIGYYTPGQNKKDRNVGYWASTHFNPDLKVLIYGLTIDQESALRKIESPDNSLGTWFDPLSRIDIYYLNGTLMLKTTYPDGSFMGRGGDGFFIAEEMISKQEGQGLRIEEKEDKGDGEYFILNSSGDLELWSEGYYFTYKDIEHWSEGDGYYFTYEK